MPESIDWTSFTGLSISSSVQEKSYFILCQHFNQTIVKEEDEKGKKEIREKRTGSEKNGQKVIFHSLNLHRCLSEVSLLN